MALTCVAPQLLRTFLFYEVRTVYNVTFWIEVLSKRSWRQKWGLYYYSHCCQWRRRLLLLFEVLQAGFVYFHYNLLSGYDARLLLLFSFLGKPRPTRIAICAEWKFTALVLLEQWQWQHYFNHLKNRTIEVWFPQITKTSYRVFIADHRDFCCCHASLEMWGLIHLGKWYRVVRSKRNSGYHCK